MTNDRFFHKTHEQAMRALPQWVRDAWTEYETNLASYPFGFAFHFPHAWNWRDNPSAVFPALPPGGSDET